MAVDSAASFKARALELGVTEAEIERFKARAVQTFAQYAFVANYQPQSTDEKPLRDMLADILGADPGDRMPVFRRLFYESHTLAIQDLRSRLDQRDGQEPRKMAMPERLERLKRLRADLPGLTIDANLEPSHALVVKVMSMIEEQAIFYIDLPSCTSREAEINQKKKDNTLEFGSDGVLKLSKHDKFTPADTSGERKVKMCLLRRALAFEMTGIASFSVIDAFISKLFLLLDRKPVSGFHQITLQQLIAADQALWQRVAQETRGQVLVTPDPKPVDKAIREAADHIDIMYHLLPVPSASKRPSEPDEAPWQNKKRPKNKPQDKEKPKASTPGPRNIVLPPNCVPRDNANQNICFGYNVGSCNMRGYKCRRGVHLCWRKDCFGKHPYSQCPKKPE